MPKLDGPVISALIAGDDVAYAKVIDALYDPVYRFVLRLCGDHSEAQDITQEAFLGVWHDAQSYEARSPFATWVFGIAYRQFLHRCQQRNDFEELAGDWQGVSRAANDQLGDTDETLFVRETIATLPSIYRIVVSLVHLYGFTYSEAAEILGVPCGTVKSRMHTAYMMLRNSLKDGRSEVSHEM